MHGPTVHNYAFRKALGYVRNKKGKPESEAVKTAFESAVHQVISTVPPYVPLYMPINNFIILLQMIKSRLGDENVILGGNITSRYYDVGFYLYVGPEESDSPYTYLNPKKSLKEVIEDFYQNLITPSAIIKDCIFGVQEEEFKTKITWKDCKEYIEIFPYLEGVHAGMIKASPSRGELTAKKKKDQMIFEIEMLD